MRKALIFAVEMGILLVFSRVLLTDFWAGRVPGWLWETLFYGVPGLAAFGLSRWQMAKRRERFSVAQAVAAVLLASLCASVFAILPGVFAGAPQPFSFPSALAVLMDIAVLTAALALATLSFRGGRPSSR